MVSIIIIIIVIIFTRPTLFDITRIPTATFLTVIVVDSV